MTINFILFREGLITGSSDWFIRADAIIAENAHSKTTTGLYLQGSDLGVSSVVVNLPVLDLLDHLSKSENQFPVRV